MGQDRGSMLFTNSTEILWMMVDTLANTITGSHMAGVAQDNV
jgi:hypothetical protein